ncbi:MAG: FecR family protein [Phenylobacterium sp.]|uniref:FecR family protein n=1 Tax=Phenylobacterium sp. TaxID=1871053 RepID=UPI003918BEE4
MSDQAELSRAETEAAEWFERLRRPSVTARALKDFQAWKQSSVNAEAFRRVEAGWRATGALVGHPEVQAAAREVLAKRPLRRRRDWRQIWLPAAVAGALGLILLAWADRALAPGYRTAVGEQRLVVLDDGSRVRLNTDSTVRVVFWGDMRRVYLRRGQAFFDVAHDPARPFLVDAGGTEVRALGTRFDVRRDRDGVSVTLVDGRVRIEDDRGEAAELLPNQQLRVTDAGLSRVRAAGADAVSWTNGRLVFRDTPLAAAVAEVNRYSAHKIELGDAAGLGDEPVSGVFDAGDVEAFASAVAAVYGLRPVDERDGRIVLVPAAQSSGG